MINDTNWKEIILDIINHDLNLMTVEYYQYLQNHDDIKLSKEELTYNILEEIANGNIKSPHITEKFAKKMINYLKKI